MTRSRNDASLYAIGGCSDETLARIDTPRGQGAPSVVSVDEAQMPHSLALVARTSTLRSADRPDQAFHFPPFRVLPRERRLERDGRRLPIGGRALDILIALLGRAGATVSKTELCEAAWPNMVVEEGALRFHIVTLRKVLEDHDRDAPRLTTVTGRGYCFSGDVLVEDLEPCRDLPPLAGILPGKPKRLFGTADDAQAAASRLLTERLLTLIGPPGVGKTTLALQIGNICAGHFAGGVFFVDLSGADARDVADTIALAIDGDEHARAALGPTATGGGPPRSLLILDSCETVVDAVADQVERLLMCRPGLNILATSREALRADGEHIHRLLPLPCPPAGEPLTPPDVLSYPAAHLFVDRVECAQLGFELCLEDVPYVVEICRKLDGIPLALELVAGQVSTYGLRQTAALIDGSLRLHWRGRRTAPSRHQTLGAALDWSYRRLSTDEHLLLQSISAFEGVFTLNEACETALEPIEATTQALATLVEKSLVLLDNVAPATRYRLLDTTRVYLRAIRDAQTCPYSKATRGNIQVELNAL